MQHHKELEMADRHALYQMNIERGKLGLKMLTAEDIVNSPTHYNTGSIECIDAIESNLSKEEFIGYLRGNIKKYEWRCRYKGHMQEDLQKANWYLNKLLKVIQGE